MCLNGSTAENQLYVDAADEFDEIDDQLPVKKGQSPEDRAKDIESILE